MRVLLDTHSFLWFIAGDRKLSDTAKAYILDPDNEALLSVASLWEIAIKISLGKLAFARPFDEFIPEQLLSNGITVLTVQVEELGLIARLPFHHRDPFDRLIVTQAITYNFPLISVDTTLDQYEITRLW
jgi:PIN domain nuclease of toxin-antitoxin system